MEREIFGLLKEMDARLSSIEEGQSEIKCELIDINKKLEVVAVQMDNDNIVTIYHGSYKKIDEPAIIKGKYTKDFGYGFYCTRNKEQSESVSKIYKTPVVNVYQLKNIDDLRVKKFEAYDEEWLDFVVHCRNGGTHDYDIVEGFMADDTICEDIDNLLSGNIDKEVFLEMMKFKWNKKQISFNSARALSKIVFLDSYLVGK